MAEFMNSSQINNSVMERLKLEGCRMGIDFLLEQRKKPYISASLFQEHLATVLIPFIDELRRNDGFPGSFKLCGFSTKYPTHLSLPAFSRCSSAISIHMQDCSEN
jgi:hypothetical protein